MNAETRKALEGSIKKWEAIIAGRDIDEGADNCPLCRIFLNRYARTCDGCPVAASTGQFGCSGSPYEQWDALPGCPSTIKDATDRKRARTIAKAELKFLKSLRPAD